MITCYRYLIPMRKFAQPIDLSLDLLRVTFIRQITGMNELVSKSDVRTDLTMKIDVPNQRLVYHL